MVPIFTVVLIVLAVISVVVGSRIHSINLNYKSRIMSQLYKIDPDVQLAVATLKSIEPMVVNFHHSRATGLEVLIPEEIEKAYVQIHGDEGQRFIDLLLGRTSTIASANFKVFMRLFDLEENLFTAICAEVGKSKFSEAYLLAGETLTIPGASPGLKHVVEEALRFSGNKPVDAVIKAFQTVPGASDVMFADGASGVVDTEGGAVEFKIRMIGSDPEAFSVLFARVDVAELMLDTKQKIAELDGRVHQLEMVGSRSEKL